MINDFLNNGASANAGGIYNVDSKLEMTDYNKLLREEGTHVWMNRAMGPLFTPSYIYNAAAAFLSGNDWYDDNWYEIVAHERAY